MSAPDRHPLPPEAAYQVECPYCGGAESIRVDAPELPSQVTLGSELPSRAVEVVTVPYVRDVDRFDPPGPSPWDDPARGSWIGSDFMPLLRFDRRFGILSSDLGGRWPGVWYRTERCTTCQRHFDAYYSFDPEHRLASHFPHLFAGQGQLLALSSAVPSAFGVLSRLRSRGSRAGAAVRAGAGWVVVAALVMALARWWSGSFTAAEYGVAVAALAIGVLGAVALIASLEDLLAWLSSEHAIDEALRIDSPPGEDTVARRNRVRHWMNFTRARFTGRPRAGSGLRTTTELLGGVLAFVSLLLVVTLTGRPTPTDVVVRLVDAVWWFPVAYLIGASLQQAATGIHYVLAGLTRVPLRLDRFDPVEALRPLGAIQRYIIRTGTAVGLILVALLAFNAAIRNLTGAHPTAWVDVWFVVVVLGAMVSLGLSRESSYLLLAVVTAAAVPVIASVDWAGLGSRHLLAVIDPVTLWFGLIFTLMLYVETRTANGLLERAVANTVEADAASLLRDLTTGQVPTDGQVLTTGQVLTETSGRSDDAATLRAEDPRTRALAVQAQQVVTQVRSTGGAWVAWAPLVAGAVLPALLDWGLGSLLG